MGDRTIRVSDDTWRALQARSRTSETLDETIARLLEASDEMNQREWEDDEIDDAIHEMQSELEESFDSD